MLFEEVGHRPGFRQLAGIPESDPVTSEKEIVIEGRGLDYLEGRLYDNQVVWIRESIL